MGNSISTKIDFSKNIYIKICPIYYQYKNYDDFLENSEKFIVSYKKLNKDDIIKFMNKNLKNNYILKFDNNNYRIENIKTYKNFIIITTKYKNITKKYNIKYYKDWINDAFYKYFNSGDLLRIKKYSNKNNIYFNMGSIFEVYQ